MPRQTEPNANNALGSLLQGMLPRSQVRSENTQAISGHPGLRPDIIVTATGRSPVVVEAEYIPARTVETEARSRLGLEVAANGRIIEAAIALRYPDAIGEVHDLRTALSSVRLAYCVFTESAKDVQRFPESGWLEGAVEDLADMVRLVSVPQQAVDQAAATLEEGIEGAAKLLDEMGAVAIKHHYGSSPPSGNDRRITDPPHGLRHHRQRPSLPRTHLRDAPEDRAPSQGVR